MYTSYNKLRKSFCDIIPHRKQHKALHKAAYMQLVVIIYNKERCIVWNYHI